MVVEPCTNRHSLIYFYQLPLKGKKQSPESFFIFRGFVGDSETWVYFLSFFKSSSAFSLMSSSTKKRPQYSHEIIFLCVRMSIWR